MSDLELQDATSTFLPKHSETYPYLEGIHICYVYIYGIQHASLDKVLDFSPHIHPKRSQKSLNFLMPLATA